MSRAAERVLILGLGSLIPVAAGLLTQTILNRPLLHRG